MSIITECNLYDKMLYNHGARRYFEQPVYMRKVKGEFVMCDMLNVVLNYCEAASVYLYSMQDFAYKTGNSDLKGDIKFFVSAAHVVFVPFGQSGFDYLKKLVSEQCGGKTVGEFLYEKFVERVDCPLNGGLLENLNAEQKQYVKEFFLNFESKDEIDCSQPRDVATLFCRLFFKLDALWADKNYGGIDKLNENFIEPIEMEIIDYNKEIFTCRLSDLIGRIPARKPLNEYEQNYISSLFGLNKRR